MRDKEKVQREECNTGKMQACPEGGALGRELQRRGNSQKIGGKVVRFCLNERGRQVMEERKEIREARGWVSS